MTPFKHHPFEFEVNQMHCIREYEIIDEGHDTLLNEIIGIVQSDTKPFQKSELYSPDKDKKFIDEDKRTSVFKKIRNKQLFQLIDNVIDK